MSILVQKLLGKRVKEIIEVEDYFQIYFDDNSILNLNNECKFSRKNLESYKGDVVVAVKIDEDLEISFTDQTIRMSLRDEDYGGPEALEFYDGPVTIIF